MKVFAQNAIALIFLLCGVVSAYSSGDSGWVARDGYLELRPKIGWLHTIGVSKDNKYLFVANSMNANYTNFEYNLLKIDYATGSILKKIKINTNYENGRIIGVHASLDSRTYIVTIEGGYNNTYHFNNQLFAHIIDIETDSVIKTILIDEFGDLFNSELQPFRNTAADYNSADSLFRITYSFSSNCVYNGRYWGSSSVNTNLYRLRKPSADTITAELVFSKP